MARRGLLVGLLLLLLLAAALGLVRANGTPVVFWWEAPTVPAVRERSPGAVFAQLGPVAPHGQAASLTVEPDGTLAVVDRTTRQLLRFTPDGQRLSTWGPDLAGGHTLEDPAAIAATGSRWYVLDRGDTPRVFELDASGTVVQVADLGRLGTYGLNDLEVDANGTIYLGDTGRNRVLVFAPNLQFAHALGSAAPSSESSSSQSGLPLGRTARSSSPSSRTAASGAGTASPLTTVRAGSATRWRGQHRRSRPRP